MRRAGVILIVAAAGLGLRPGPVAGQVFMTQEEALDLAFPGARVERRSAFLTDTQLERARTMAGPEAPVDASIVTYYAAFDGARPVGAAYFDAHRVRTRDEVLMVVVSPEATIVAIEILRFAEPPEYVAPEPWLRQFPGSTLDAELSVRGGIAGITGATLTSRAVTAAARRSLALHLAIDPFGASRLR